jgi:hypothetical protein
MSFVLDVRPISRSSPSRCWKIKYKSRNDTAEIMPGRCRSSITAGRRHVQRSGTPQAISEDFPMAMDRWPWYQREVGTAPVAGMRCSACVIPDRSSYRR